MGETGHSWHFRALNKHGHQISVCGQGSDCRIFVFAHKATVTLDIRAEDGGELSFETFLFHGSSLVLRSGANRFKEMQHGASGPARYRKNVFQIKI